ncbi:patatin-like phospholipase family protein [Litorisediminicola beolgyonensis]|uniref:Patatin-like phospholipase family protein n=1 Tax=Litorisediminicola beolgyonensis TaxID=1173614 RepID=A0ABW3ZFM2_9RHOB
MAGLPHNPTQLVFSGGGLRCFWQGGFMSVLGQDRSFRPERITGVSGGALAGAAWIAGLERRLLDEMCAEFDKQDSNLDLFDPDEDGITPHQRLYCEVVDRIIDAEAAQKIAEGPQFQILLAFPPETGFPTLTGMGMAATYEAELHLVNSPHFSWAEKFGLTSTLVDANQAARDGDLVNLICAAAVIPPVFEPPLWHGRRVVDGGMASQAPLPEPDEGETLVLLTRDYRRLPEVEGRTYIAPSSETPADKIDFTSPEKLKDTWAHGEADARRILDDTTDINPTVA